MAKSPEGQSLSDAAGAAKEGRARPRTEKSSVTIRNDTLVTDPRKGKLSTSNAIPATPVAARTPVSRTHTTEAAFGEGPGAAPHAPADDAASEEARWRTLASNARQRVEDGKERLEELTAEAAKLESDFYAWDDGQYRDNVIKPAWDRKKEELEAARKELAEAEKDLADLPEKARKAGALPGWLRQ